MRVGLSFPPSGDIKPKEVELIYYLYTGKKNKLISLHAIGVRCVAPLIYNLGTRWKIVVSFTPATLAL